WRYATGKTRSRQESAQNIGRFSPSTGLRGALVNVTARICKPSVARFVSVFGFPGCSSTAYLFNRLDPLCPPSRGLERIGIVARFADNFPLAELENIGDMVDAPTIVGASLDHPDISTTHDTTHGDCWRPRIGLLHRLHVVTTADALA